MVSKAIESAQTKVEGYNFDIRKHVVEYDDVMNSQRETIYHERERILRSEDLSPTVLAMLAEELRDAGHRAHCREFPGTGTGRAARPAETMFPSFSPPTLAALDEIVGPGHDGPAAVVDSGRGRSTTRKREEIGEDGIAVLERLVLLRVIDGLWVEHLTAIDDMRRGIGLRAYSQRDPLNEFKVEAYHMFEELKATIRHDVTHTIFRVTVTREPVQQAAPQQMRESRPDVAPGAQPMSAAAPAAGSGNGSGNGGVPQPVRTGTKIGRNDPCFCGSGKKYKRCHGA